MNYKLDNVSISSFGAYPTVNDRALSLSGAFDLPKRKGNTEYNWGTHIEPFTDAADIEYDGRSLSLDLAVNASGLDALLTACMNCSVLSCDLDSFNVVLKDEIQVDKIGSYRVLHVKFWQNDYVMKALTTTPSATGTIRLNNFNMKNDFGIYVSYIDGQNDLPRRIEVQTTEFYTRKNYRENKEITLTCYMAGSSVADLYVKMTQFHSLIGSAGIKSFVSENINCELYFKDGLKADMRSEKLIKFTLTGVVI